MSNLDRYITELNLKIPNDDNGASYHGAILCAVILDAIHMLKSEQYPIMASMASKIVEELKDSDFAGTMRLVMNAEPQDNHRYIYEQLGLFEGARVIAISEIDDDGDVCDGATGELMDKNHFPDSCDDRSELEYDWYCPNCDPVEPGRWLSSQIDEVIEDE